MTPPAATEWREASEARPTVSRRAPRFAALLAPFMAATLLDRSFPGGADAYEPEEELVCLMQRTVSLEHSSGVARAPMEKEQNLDAAPPISLMDAGAEQSVDRAWQKVHRGLHGAEASKQHPGPGRTVRMTAAIFLATAMLSAGLLCVQTRNGSWFLLALAATLPQQRLRRQYEKFRIARGMDAPEHQAAREQESLPLVSMTPAALPTTTFSGSTRCLENMASGKATELHLGNKLGNMVLCVSLQPVLPGIQVVTVEVEHDGGHRTPIATCFSEEGPAFEVRDAAGTFTGLCGPAVAGAADCRRYSLLRGSAGQALSLEGPPDGRPRPSHGALVVKAPSGETLGTMSLDEDDVQLTLKHSCLDSVVVASIMGFYLLTP